MLKTIIFIICLTISLNSMSYEFNDFKTDLSSPLENDESRDILLKGSLLTLLLITQRENFVDPLSLKYGEEEKPMGDLAIFGDYMGQLVPNLTYMGFHYFSETSDSNRKLNYMLKTTVFTGLTTGVLKRVINQRRPHKGDRLSFPSGHTSTAFAFAGVIHYEYQDTLYSSLGFTMASIVGLSRINDNAHYLHDVVFGATLGLAYACALRDSQTKFILYPIDSGVGLSYLY